MTYAAKLDDENVVLEVIVGTAEWAIANLGGRWVDSPKIGPGWIYEHGQFVPPHVDELHDDVGLG